MFQKTIKLVCSMRPVSPAGHFISSVDGGWRDLSGGIHRLPCPTQGLRERPKQEASSSQSIYWTLWGTRAPAQCIEGPWVGGSVGPGRGSTQRSLKKDHKACVSGTEATSGWGGARGDAGDAG